MSFLITIFVLLKITITNQTLKIVKTMTEHLLKTNPIVKQLKTIVNDIDEVETSYSEEYNVHVIKRKKYPSFTGITANQLCDNLAFFVYEGFFILSDLRTGFYFKLETLDDLIYLCEEDFSSEHIESIFNCMQKNKV